MGSPIGVIGGGTVCHSALPGDLMTDDDPTDDERARPFSELFLLKAECGRQLESFVRKRLRDDPDAIKVVDLCWEDLEKKWDRQRELTRPRALLYQLAYYRTNDRIRQINLRPEHSFGDLSSVLDDTAAALSEFVSSLVVRVDVRAAIAELPVRQQDVLRFVYGYDLAYEDAAALMACPVHAIGNLLRAAKANLKKSRHLAGYRVAAPSSPPEVHR
jgi:DNA-directed RNA polymerase specialized sigma24 family protein